ncbi:hypothetical protein [Marinobacterium sedimentorum]|uniref:hypothetical protein n=1 Tax=Marinobacterium sedimentorum TaxID=2927804 RepID=UPI0020C6798D|nr:hypothetical protein [Marinobacterium sedimentorum]MCP8690017.1 hypothetical protein [Marinobacterium sedimentorum]
MTERPRLSLPGLFFVLVLMEILFGFLKKLSPTLYQPFDLLEKLIPIAALAICALILNGRLSRPIAFSLLFYGLYLLYGIVISYLNHKSSAVIFYQLYHEIKYIAIMVTFSVLHCSDRWSRKSLKVCTLVLLLSIPLILFQLGASGAYDSLFSNGGHFERGYVGGLQLPRAVGVFWHPSQLAIFSLLAIILLSSDQSMTRLRRPLYILLFTLCAVLTIQRLELFLLLCSCYAIYLMKDRHKLYLSAHFGHLILAVGAAFCISVLVKPGLYAGLVESLPSPRSWIFYQSVQTLLNSSYWGAGWGTIGSHAAADMTNAYSLSDLSDLWWVQRGLYLYDTYWPHVIGETGLPGLCLLVLSIVCLANQFVGFNARLIFFILFLTSLLSSNLQSIFYLVMFGWFIMVSENQSRQRLIAAHAP